MVGYCLVEGEFDRLSPSCDPSSLAPVSQRGSDRETENMLVPTGRFERRITKAHAVELLDKEELPMTEHGAITENVSSRGARVITDSTCAPGESVVLGALEENLKSPARVVYCQRLADGRFAVGLQFNRRFEKWEKLP